MKGKGAKKAKCKKASKTAVRAEQKKIKLKELPKKQRQALLFLPALIAQKGMEAPKFSDNAVVVFNSPESLSIMDGKSRFSALLKENATYCTAGGTKMIRIAGRKMEKI